MALLSPRARLPTLALLTLLASCHGASEGGILEVDRFETAVRCDEAGCVMDDRVAELPVPFPTVSPVEGFAFLSLEIQEDLLIYAEIPAGDGLGHLEIELHGGADAEVSYVERVAGDEVFRSVRATGVLEVPFDPMAESCSCETGRMELRLFDAGDDGLLDTGDDRVRQLSGGRFSRGDEFCVATRRLQVGDTLEVRRVDRCPDRPASAPAPSAPPSPPPSSSPESEPVSCDLGGCDTTSCDGGSSSGGCDGDGSSGSGGCAGDDSASCDGGGGDATCTGDAGALPARIPRGCRGGFGDGRFQLVFLLAVILVDLRRRAAVALA